MIYAYRKSLQDFAHREIPENYIKMIKIYAWISSSTCQAFDLKKKQQWTDETKPQKEGNNRTRRPLCSCLTQRNLEFFTSHQYSHLQKYIEYNIFVFCFCFLWDRGTGPLYDQGAIIVLNVQWHILVPNCIQSMHVQLTRKVSIQSTLWKYYIVYRF